MLLQQVLLENNGGEPLVIRAWRMLVGCAMLNQTTRAQVDAVWPEFFRRWPDSVAAAVTAGDWMGERQMQQVLRPCGLALRKTLTIQKMSRQWTDHFLKHGEIPEHVLHLYGCGKYADDSYQLFVVGNWDVVPTDKELLAYMGRATREAA